MLVCLSCVLMMEEAEEDASKGPKLEGPQFCWTSEGLVGKSAIAKPQPRGSTEPATYYRGACTTKSRTIDSTGWQPNASTALAAALPTSTLFDLSRTHHGLWD